MRIIFIPQYPTAMRYQEWWYWKLPAEFRKAGFEVVTLGQDYGSSIEDECGFSPVKAAIEFETDQIREYMDMTLRPDDVLFLADLSFPGLFANVLHHKKPSRMFAFCHATSLNDHDYFQYVRHSKFTVELGQARLFANIFVGSRYHAQKLGSCDWPRNLMVTGLPFPPKSVISHMRTVKKRFLISTARPCMQKIDVELENIVELQYHTMIYRRKYTNWHDYCRALSESKVLLVTAKEETFGYQIVDAIINNCIPVVPNDFSYVEMVPREYRYDNATEMLDILDKIQACQLGIPELLCKARIKNFYRNISKIIRKEREDYPF
jgi:hypothetical protein